MSCGYILFIYLKGNSSCPVLSFEKYISKLNPECEFLWQRPKRNVEAQDHIWFDNMVVGKNSLGSMMSTISKDCNLSVKYTNHCIRATCITLLDESGYEGRHIIGITKHKSETSLKHYASHLSETKKHQMSNALANKILPNKENDSPMTLVQKCASPEPETMDLNLFDLGNLDFLELPYLENLNAIEPIASAKEKLNTMEPRAQATATITKSPEKREFNSCSFSNCSIVINHK